MTATKSLSFKALIFDMDGTMVDNMMVHHRAWQRKLGSLGLSMTLEEVMRDIHGVNDEIIKRLFGDRFSDLEIKQIALEKEAEYREMFKDQIGLLAGLEDFLDRAKALRIPMGIGTAAPVENVDFSSTALGLDRWFDVVVHAGMVIKGKPDPEVFEQVAERLGVSLRDSIVFEDSPTGAKAADNGGAHCVVLTTTHTKKEFENITAVKGVAIDYTAMILEETKENKTFILKLS